MSELNIFKLLILNATCYLMVVLFFLSSCNHTRPQVLVSIFLAGVFRSALLTLFGSGS